MLLTPISSTESGTPERRKDSFPGRLACGVQRADSCFQQDAQSLVDTRAEIILKEYEAKENISCHEVPMISTLYKPISWQIDNWVRAGIPSQFHDNTATFHGNRAQCKYYGGLGFFVRLIA